MFQSHSRTEASAPALHHAHPTDRPPPGTRRLGKGKPGGAEAGPSSAGVPARPWSGRPGRAGRAGKAGRPGGPGRPAGGRGAGAPLGGAGARQHLLLPELRGTLPRSRRARAARGRARVELRAPRRSAVGGGAEPVGQGPRRGAGADPTPESGDGRTGSASTTA